MDSNLTNVLDSKDIARHLKIRSRRRLYKLMNDDTFPPFRIGRQWYVLEDDLMAWLRNRKKAPSSVSVRVQRRK